MSVYVLVHGAFHGGWCFDLLRERLEAEGHTVFAPTLSGVGERLHLAGTASINLATHIAEIADLIRFRDLEDVVLCGHSYGVMVAAGVADAWSDKIRTVVYLDGMIPENGDTLFSILPSVVEAFLAQAAANGGLHVSPFPAAAFGVAEKHQAWVDSKLTTHPLACFTQAISLTGAYKSVPRKLLIYNTTDIGIPTNIPQTYEAQRGVETVQVFPLPGGHDLMIDAVDALSDILLSHA
ncbi:alpha/beta fold hydrolase [Frigidibacter mobilis]|uniref:Esterase n=1 Tax=Frigidibacter mobilis TaxID=1335048 RepID=A0A159Z1N3_9RHOB|nr:alpha/beta hydrolase [Frigidibacter mobilis]AMY68866.1 esterase [Frigidibacter mobilis]